jgi:aminoglycoside phosphotransferase (APT) family kinase protein
MDVLPAELDDDPVRRAALGNWLAGRLEAPVEVRTLTRPRSGYSAETAVVDALVARTPRRFVVRAQTPDPPVYPKQGRVRRLRILDIEVQYRVMAALAEHSTVPVAPLVGFDRSMDVWGNAFFVMGHIDGEVPVESPPYPSAGFFADATPAERETMVRSGIEVLAAVHAVDWRAAGLDWLLPADGTVPGTAHQLALWQDYAGRELDGRMFPELDDAFAWVADHLPADEPVGLCWGDGRPGNIIFGSDLRPLCATDFEAVSIASPDLDLGWWLMFDRTMHENAWGHERTDRPEGEPTREEQVAHYAAVAGREPQALDVHEVFAAARYAAIVVRVMNRLVARGDVPADHTIWRENPAAACLVALVDERVR